MNMQVDANRDNTVFIMEARGGYPYDGIVSEGYTVCRAYKGKSLSSRLMRELWFRIPFFPDKFFFDKSILKLKPQYVIVRDTLITRSYLLWLKKILPDAQINFYYDNLVGRARHLRPEKIPDGVRAWSFDEGDCEKYGLRMRMVPMYSKRYVYNAPEKKYDLLFVGRDKGRGERLLKLDKYLRENGLSTKFVIVKDGRFSLQKKYYQGEVPYDTVVKWVAESHAVLNVADGYKFGIGLRDTECYVNKVKLVTTNKYVKNNGLNKPQNVFVLSDSNWNLLIDFLRKPYEDSKPIDWAVISVDRSVREITT